MLPDVAPLGVHEVGLAVEIVVAERLDAHPVDGPHVVLVGHCRSRLLDAPQVLRQPARGGRGVEHDLGAVEPERPPTLGEVTVVTDVDADLADRGVEDRVAAVAGTEVELFPEPVHVRDVLLAVLTEVGAVGVEHRCGVVEEAGSGVFVDRQHHDHVQFLGQGLEALDDGTGDCFGVLVELRVLHLAEVGAVEQLLEADDLCALLGCFAGVLLMLDDHRLFVAGPIGLD